MKSSRIQVFRDYEVGLSKLMLGIVHGIRQEERRQIEHPTEFLQVFP